MQFTIMGDSWCWGEFPPDSHTYKGRWSNNLPLILRGAGHQCQVLAEAGSSNLTQTERAHEQGVQGQVIWYITDPFRDLEHDFRPGPVREYSLLHERVQTVAQYHHERERLLRARFEEMRDHPVWLLGGVCPIPQWVGRDYPQFRVLCEDVCRYLTGVPVPLAMCRKWDHYDCSPELVDLYHEHEQETQRFRDRAKNEPASPEHEWFWPDGIHPNRQAHQRVYDDLILPLIRP